MVKQAPQAPTQPVHSDAPGVERLRMRKILVPTDFSPPATRAVHYAESLAQSYGAQLILLHVFQPPAPIYGQLVSEALAQAAEVDRETARVRLRESCEEIRRASRIEVEAVLCDGSPHKEICARAEELEIDLIVLGTHGYRGLNHLLHLGSTAERVVRLASCPVFVVRQRGRQLVPAPVS